MGNITGGEEIEKITVGGGSIEKKTEGEYLGQIIAFDKQTREITQRKEPGRHGIHSSLSSKYTKTRYYSYTLKSKS